MIAISMSCVILVVAFPWCMTPLPKRTECYCECCAPRLMTPHMDPASTFVSKSSSMSVAMAAIPSRNVKDGIITSNASRESEWGLDSSSDISWSLRKSLGLMRSALRLPIRQALENYGVCFTFNAHVCANAWAKVDTDMYHKMCKNNWELWFSKCSANLSIQFGPNLKNPNKKMRRFCYQNTC